MIKPMEVFYLRETMQIRLIWTLNWFKNTSTLYSLLLEYRVGIRVRVTQLFGGTLDPNRYEVDLTNCIIAITRF